MRPKSISPLRRKLLKGLLVVLLVCVVGVLVLTFSIELSVKGICKTATQAHPGDKVQALTMYVKSDEYGYDTRRYRANNHAIWALGQLGDRRALPFLRDLVTGQPCDHETNLCQGEIHKAIEKLESNSFNLPAFLWRGLLNY